MCKKCRLNKYRIKGSSGVGLLSERQEQISKLGFHSQTAQFFPDMHFT